MYTRAAAEFERRSAGDAKKKKKMMMVDHRGDPGFGCGLALHTVMDVAAERGDFSNVSSSDVRTSALQLMVDTAIVSRRAPAPLPPLQRPRTGRAAVSEWHSEPPSRPCGTPAERRSAAAVAQSVEPFAPLIARLTHADLATIVPSLCAAATAHPAAVLPMAIRLMSSTPADLSRYIKSHLAKALCTLMATHGAAPQVCALTAMLVTSCVSQCSETSVFECLIVP
jgi:hypothetical protein